MSIYRNLIRGFILTIAIIGLHFSVAESVEQPLKVGSVQEGLLVEASSEKSLECTIQDMFGCWVDMEDLESEEDCTIGMYQTDEPDKMLCLIEQSMEEVSSDEPLECVIENIFGCWVHLEDLESEEDCTIGMYQTDEPDKIVCLTEEAIEDVVSES